MIVLYFRYDLIPYHRLVLVLQSSGLGLWNAGITSMCHHTIPIKMCYVFFFHFHTCLCVAHDCVCVHVFYVYGCIFVRVCLHMCSYAGFTCQLALRILYILLGAIFTGSCYANPAFLCGVHGIWTYCCINLIKGETPNQWTWPVFFSGNVVLESQKF